MSTEICANCNQPIGNLEPAMLWHSKVVCVGCYKRLNATAPVEPANTLEQIAYAARLPNIPPPQKKSIWRSSIGMVLIGLFGFCLCVGLFVSALTRSSRAFHPSPAERSVQTTQNFDKDLAKADQLYAGLQDLVKKRTIHSIDWNRKIMRIDPLQWSVLDLETKRGAINGFYSYYVRSGETFVHVKVMSSRNDVDVFAEEDEFSGPKILR